MQQESVFYCDEEIKKAFYLLANLPPKRRASFISQIFYAAIAHGIDLENLPSSETCVTTVSSD